MIFFAWKERDGGGERGLWGRERKEMKKGLFS
jgi:hypothetical protein